VVRRAGSGWPLEGLDQERGRHEGGAGAEPQHAAGANVGAVRGSHAATLGAGGNRPVIATSWPANGIAAPASPVICG
jgi:hypothetical protein